VAQLPVEINARVRYWMERFTTDQRSTFEQYMSRKGHYEDLVVERLRARGMPDELLYLAMIESGFLPRASSQVAAVGLWQFMGPTAQQYGLRVDSWVDERRDPIRATDAALTYLQWLHERYDSWYLAAAAYNAGPGRVDQALRRWSPDSGTDDVDLYWEIIDHLPRETREHVPKLLAATLLARNAAALGFEIEPEQAYAFDRVWVPGGTPLRVVARGLEVPPQLIRDLNPHLLRGVTPPGGSYELRVPVGRSAQVVASIGGGRWGSPRAADD
jgi:membrane-bound lytic murein transglycosylase D